MNADNVTPNIGTEFDEFLKMFKNLPEDENERACMIASLRTAFLQGACSIMELQMRHTAANCAHLTRHLLNEMQVQKAVNSILIL